MPIGVQLNAVFNVDGTTYTANMNLPTTTPTGAAPFLFLVTSAPTGGGSATTTTLLTVAVGGQDQVYVAVQPPTSLITAAVGDIVQALDVVVSEGTFDPKSQTFNGSTPTPPPAAA